MSQTQPPAHPRSRDIKVAVIEDLRADATLVGWLYPDGNAPTAAIDRSRIHEYDPGSETDELPVQIAVAATIAGSEWRGGPMSRSYFVQLTVQVTDDYYERYTGLQLDDIFDRCDTLLCSPPIPRVYPSGPESGSPHEMQTGANRRRFDARWRFKTHRMTH